MNGTPTRGVAPEALLTDIDALTGSEHLLGHEKGELRRIRNRVATSLRALQRGEQP
jgi:hypothetical protein